MSNLAQSTRQQKLGRRAPGLTIKLFGPMEVLVHGRQLPRLRSRKGMWLLALLAIRANQDVDRDWLAESLWPDCDDEHAKKSLRQSLFDLRAALGEEAWRLHSATPQTLRLDTSSAELDLAAFDRRSSATDVESLRECEEIYRGPLLEGCSEEWVLDERRHREAQFLVVLQRLTAIATDAWDHDSAVRYLRRAVGVDPYSEEIRRSLMKALAQGGDSVSALHTYCELRALLMSELRVEPAAETTNLYKQIRESLPASAGEQPSRPPKPPLKLPQPTAVTSPRRLPSPLTALIGRRESIDQVKRLLADSRLVTLTGPGGIGKTRLSLRVAEELQVDYEHGAEFVSLAALADPATVPDAVRAALGIPPGAGKQSAIDTLKDYLESRELLLVLDNCEHLLTACSSLADNLLRHCPDLRILETSRQPLGLDGEAIWRVPPLAVPPADQRDFTARAAEGAPLAENYAAVRLFAERASQAEASFELTPITTAAVVEICRRLDGIPLAIELVAARARSLPIEEILARLNQGFSLLAGGVALVPRHRTLEAAFLWSWELLSSAEQLVLGRLSVFAGSWCLEGAEEICSGDGVNKTEIVEIVTSLVDRSLVCLSPAIAATSGTEPVNGGGRYWLLETIRQFAGDRLKSTGQSDVWRSRHLAYYRALGEQAESRLTTSEQQRWFDRLDAEHDNIREGLAWASSDHGSIGDGLRLAGAIWRFWDVRGYSREGRRWLSSLLAKGTAECAPELRAKALFAAGELASRYGDYAEARRVNEECLAIRRHLGDRAGITAALIGLGNTASLQCEYDSARSLYEESLSISRETGDRRAVAVALNNLGNHAIDRNDFDEARALHQENLDIRRELGDQRGVAIALNNLAIIAQHEGDYATAQALHTECLAHHRELGNRRGIAVALCNLGEDLRLLHDFDAAESLLAESLAILWELGDYTNIAGTLESHASVRSATGRFTEAATLWGSAQRLREELGAPKTHDELSHYEEQVSAARAGAGDIAFDTAWSKGRTMSLDEAVTLALDTS